MNSARQIAGVIPISLTDILLYSFIASIAWEKVNVGQEDVGRLHTLQGNVSQVVHRIEGLEVYSMYEI